MDSFISTFHIDWKIIIAQAINFIIVFLVLYFLAIKPLKKIMSERTETIEKGLNDAKENALVIENSRKEYEKVINDARAEAHVIFQEGKKEAEAKKAQILEDAKVQVEGMIASGKKTLENEKARMVDEAKTEIVSLVVKATEKLLEQTADSKLDEKLAKQVKDIK
ncbi:F0F1 ATP synthase subunit B [Candidatus Nomurabacteria bacterium]|nr:F0F1 ATP synthase subunit B [Candidatus Nomurabacteria bacterium]